MGFSTLLAAPDNAAARWQLRDGSQTIDSLDDADLLDRIPRYIGAADPSLPLLRRGYERRWVSAEEAVRRVVSERGEILGARVGATLSTITVSPLLVLWLGGAPVYAIGLAVLLAAGGAAVLLGRGAEVIVRVLCLQSMGTMLALAAKWGGISGMIVGLYVPVAATAAATLLGARIGSWMGHSAHARLLRRMRPPIAATARNERSEDAVAA